MKYVFIVNPCSGNKIPDKIEERISEVCRGAGVDYQIYFAADRDSVCGYADRVLSECGDEACRFYACGGDGTFSNMVKCVYGHDNVEVGFIPYGTGNDFVRTFAAVDDFRDIESQLYGSSIPIDIAKVNDRICANMTNIGFDCAVVSAVDKLRKSPFIGNFLGYTIGVVLTLFRRPTCRLYVSCDGEPEDEQRVLLAAVGNGCYYGGGYKPCCLARPDDGRLDIVTVPVVSRARFISMVGKYKRGTYLDTKLGRERIKYRKASLVHILSDTPIDVCIDGDIERMSDVRMSVLHNGVRFILPRGVSYEPTDAQFVAVHGGAVFNVLSE